MRLTHRKRKPEPPLKKRLKRIFLALSAAVLLAILSLAVAISYESDCPAPVSYAGEGPSMRALMQRCYGAPDVLTLEQVAKPVPADDEVLVKVHAAGTNPLDWHYMRGKPYFMRLSTGFGAPKQTALGVDFAGVVESVGAKVTQFKVGDEVFGGRRGSFAEYLVVGEADSILHKPANLSFEQAAAVPIAAVTALQGLRDQGKVGAGTKVLINGASGGVGTFAVQIAKALGAEVTGVCSTRNVDLVRSIGADHVIDYTRDDFTASGIQYDLILDNVSNRSLSDLRRALKPQGKLVIIGGADGDPWLGPMMQPLKAQFVGPFVSQEMGMMLASLNPEDLKVIADWMESGKVTPVIDRRYPFAETVEAIRYLEEGRARGKVVVHMF